MATKKQIQDLMRQYIDGVYDGDNFPSTVETLYKGAKEDAVSTQEIYDQDPKDLQWFYDSFALEFEYVAWYEKKYPNGVWNR